MKIPTAAHIGAMVREYRELRKWSMTEFSAKLREAGLSNFHPTTVSRLERGERALKIDEIYVVANVLRANLDDLIVIPYEKWEMDHDELNQNRQGAEWFAQWSAYWLVRLEDEIADLEEKIVRMQELINDGEVPEEEIPKIEKLLADSKVAASAGRVEHWASIIRELEPKERDKFRGSR